MWRSVSRVTAVVLLSVALLAASCGSDSEDPEPEEAGFEQLFCNVGEPADGPVVDDHDDSADGDDSWLIDPELLVVPPEGIDAAIDEVAEAGGDAAGVPLNSDEFGELIEERYQLGDGFGGGRLIPNIEGDDLLEQVAESVALVAVDGLDGPTLLEVIEVLRAGEVDARPLFAVRYQGHWGVLPGIDPVVHTPLQSSVDLRSDIDAAMVPPAAASGEAKKIGIVDSGFVASSASFVSFSSALDTEAPGTKEDLKDNDCFVSHGTFTASIIKQVNPNTQLFGASAPPLRASAASLFTTPAGSPSIAHHVITDEIAILLALRRLPEVDVLNLSFGTEGVETGNPLDSAFGCESTDTWMGPAVVEAALCLAAEASAYAAGGARDSVNPMFPAAFPAVVGVGATEGGAGAGEPLITWDHGVPGNPSNNLWWINVRDRGCNLVGIGTDSADQAVVWSGSSFATAVVSAKAADSSATIPDSAKGELTAFDVDQCSP